jgi:ADP-L-glycero-D-manno-heptose 6-epimerase
MGAVSSTTEPDADLIVHSNFTLSRDLWDWCAAHGKRLIYASSAATYGDGSRGFDDAGDLAFLQRLAPLNLYARSKHETDMAIRRLLDDGAPAPAQWAGLKFFNVYGPHERHKGEQRSIVNKLYGEIAASGHARLFKSHNPDYADGGQLRDFIWVGDCVDVMLWLLDHRSVSGLFNVGTGQARSFLDVAAAVFAALGRTPDIEFVDMPLSLRDKYQYYTRAEMARLRGAGYRRQFTALETGVQDYVNHLAAQS